MAEQLNFDNWKDQVLRGHIDSWIMEIVQDDDKFKNLLSDLADITIEMDKHG